MAWIKHDGGPNCPVDPNSRPLLIFKDGWDASEAIRKNPKWTAKSANWANVAKYWPVTPPAIEGMEKTNV